MFAKYTVPSHLCIWCGKVDVKKILKFVLLARYSFHIDKYVMYPSLKVLAWWIFYHLIETEWVENKMWARKSENGFFFFFCSLACCVVDARKENRLNYAYEKKKKNHHHKQSITVPVCLFVLRFFLFSSAACTFQMSQF